MKGEGGGEGLAKEGKRCVFKCGCSNYFFLNSANLICRGTAISKYFRGSLGIRDNESRLYISSICADKYYCSVVELHM